MPLDAVFDGLGVQLLAVMEDDALAELEGQVKIVRRPAPLGRQLGNQLQILVDVDELVAEAGEDDAADEGARDGRIEDVGILGQADAQIRLSQRGSLKRKRGHSRQQ